MSAPGGGLLQVRVAHLGLDRTTNTPVVILQENDGQRVLPIWIGPAEASAIAMELAGVKFSRPLTHDLLKQVIVGLGASYKTQENTLSASRWNIGVCRLVLTEADSPAILDNAAIYLPCKFSGLNSPPWILALSI